MSQQPYSPQLGVDYQWRGEGGIIGAVGRARDRKRAQLERERQEKHERKQRRQQLLAARAEAHAALQPMPAAPGPPALPPVASSAAAAITVTAASGGGGGGGADKLLQPAEVAALLTDLNGGQPPPLEELLPVLYECGADGSGALASSQLTAVVVAWNRRVRAQGRPGLGSSPPGGAGGGDARPQPPRSGCGCCSVS